MPRMRLAIRSGWNTSILSSFSPVPANLMGLPVTARMDRAAPPRASPSSLVSMTPVNVQRLVKGLGGVDRVLADHGVHHQAEFPWGQTADLTRLAARSIRASSTWSRPAVSKNTISFPCFLACSTAGLGDIHRVGLSHLEHWNIQLGANHLQLREWQRGGRCRRRPAEAVCPAFSSVQPAWPRWWSCPRP